MSAKTASARYAFLADTYETEILKTLSVWSLCEEQDLDVRPRAGDPRGRSLREHMVHQCLSENAWFAGMLGIAVTAEPLPKPETRAGFVRAYAANAMLRLRGLCAAADPWWEQVVAFFDVERSRAWIVTRRIAHTAHHRGQQTALLRVLGRELYSTYGPTADTGGLMQHGAGVVYAYADLDTLLAQQESAQRAPLPRPGSQPLSERPDAS